MANFCPDCGTAREDGAEICGNCNHQFTAPAIVAAPAIAPDSEADTSDGEIEAPTRSKWLSPKWIGIAAGTIALATAGVWVVTSNGLSGFASSATATVDVSLLPVSFGGKCGYVDTAGKMVINPQFDNAFAFNKRLGVAAVIVSEKWGLIDREGKYVVNPQFDEMNTSNRGQNTIVSLSGKKGTIDETGKFVINPQFDEISVFDSDGMAVAQVGKKSGVIDSTGKYIISPEFDDIRADWENYRENSFKILSGRVLVMQQGKFGYVDNTGKVIIQPQFSYAGAFGSTGYALAAIEEADKEAFERLRDSNAGAVEQLIRERLSQWLLGDIRRDGLRLSFDLNNYMMADQIRVWLIQNVKQGQWSVSSDVSRDAQGYPTGASIVMIQTLEAPKRNKYGYIDESGKFIIPPQFNDAGNFTGAGLASVQVGTAFGYIDTKGKVTINPQWPRAEAFRQVAGTWLAIVGVAEEGSDKLRFGVIDTKGAYKINPQFDSLGNFSQAGFAIVQSGELQGAIDTAGHYVLQPIYSTLSAIEGTSNFVFVKSIAGTKDMQEIGVIGSAGNVITTTRGGVCGGLYSLGG